MEDDEGDEDDIMEVGGDDPFEEEDDIDSAEEDILNEERIDGADRRAVRQMDIININDRLDDNPRLGDPHRFGGGPYRRHM